MEEIKDRETCLEMGVHLVHLATAYFCLNRLSSCRGLNKGAHLVYSRLLLAATYFCLIVQLSGIEDQNL